jgi:hypothetical protein
MYAKEGIKIEKPSKPKKKRKKLPEIEKGIIPGYKAFIKDTIYDVINNQNDFNLLVKQVPTLITFLPCELRQEIKADYMDSMGKLLLKIVNRLNEGEFISKR